MIHNVQLQFMKEQNGGEGDLLEQAMMVGNPAGAGGCWIKKKVLCKPFFLIRFSVLQVSAIQN